MKEFFAVVGCFHLMLFVLGALNVIDYYVCIKGPGECHIEEQK
jgi:hypothetical protein